MSTPVLSGINDFVSHLTGLLTQPKATAVAPPDPWVAPKFYDAQFPQGSTIAPTDPFQQKMQAEGMRQDPHNPALYYKVMDNPQSDDSLPMQPTAASQGTQTPAYTVPTNFYSFKDMIAKSAQDKGVPAAYLAGMLAHESAQFNPKYVYGIHTDGHGMGMAGIDDRYNPGITKQQAFDPQFAVNYAAQHLADGIKAEGNPYKALRRYNGGPDYESPRPGFQGIPVAQRTQNYADMVSKQADAYGKEFGP